MAFWGIATGKRGDFGALSPIKHDRPTGAGRVMETSEPGVTVAVAPGGDGIVIDSEGGSDRGEGLAAVKFEQGRSAFEGLDGQRAFGEQSLQALAVGIGEGDMLFVHIGSVRQATEKCKKTSLTDYSVPDGKVTAYFVSFEAAAAVDAAVAATAGAASGVVSNVDGLVVS